MDRLDRGFILGALTSSVKDILNLINFHVFHITNIRYLDFMANLVLGRPVHSLAETIICQILEIGYEGLIGMIFIIFAYHCPYRKNLWFKGMVMGTIVYFLNYSVASLYKLPVIRLTDAKTVTSQIVTSVIFGLLLGIGVKWWGKKIGDAVDH